MANSYSNFQRKSFNKGKIANIYQKATENSKISANSAFTSRLNDFEMRFPLIKNSIRTQ